MSFFINILDIVKIPGIRQYLLIKEEGQVVSHNISRPETVAPQLKLAGLGCRELVPEKFYGGFRYMILEQESDDPLVLFKLGTCFLGVWSDRTVRTAVMIKEVMRFLAEITSSGRDKKDAV